MPKMARSDPQRAERPDPRDRHQPSSFARPEWRQPAAPGSWASNRFTKMPTIHAISG
jgi:hypothetical protein